MWDELKSTNQTQKNSQYYYKTHKKATQKAIEIGFINIIITN